MNAESGQPITSYNTKIYVDDIIIGCIQDIKIHTSAHEAIPEIEITFPDLRPYKSSIVDSIAASVELLSNFPNVKVTLLKLEAAE